jgi:hypothetical protein
MKFFSNLIKLILISKILSIEFLESKKENQISCDEEFIILDSSGFTKGEKIFLEMEAKRFTKDFINYEFLDDLSPYENITKINKIPFYEKDSKNHKYSTKTSIKREFDTPILVTKYFTIKKNIKKENKGDYLVILFYCEGDVKIKNAENGNKHDFLLNKIFIFVFLFFLILFNIIIFIRYKIFNEKANNHDIKNSNNKSININNTNSQYVSSNNNELSNQNLVNKAITYKKK